MSAEALPWQSITSAITAFASASEAASGRRRPSPFKVPFETACATSTAWAAVTETSLEPSFARIQRAASAMGAPSGPVAIASTGRVSDPLNTELGSLRREETQVTAAMTSGGLTWPSPSESIRASVRYAISRPFTGQLRATQSFGSSWLRYFRSSEDPRLT